VGSAAFSPDGKTILTGCADHAARLWDTVTGRPIGRPMLHASSGSRYLRAAFSPDGRFVLTNDLNTVRLWDVPAPLPQSLPRLAAWVETATGLDLDERGSVHVLDRAVWLERRSRLEQLGGPPPPDPAARLDLILYGADPAARGDAWKQRGHWDRAEEAYAEAIRARPLERSIWDALARLHAERGRLDRAAATLADAVRRMPEDAGLRRRWGLALLASGDRSGWQGATAALLDRLGSTINPRTANDVAWACSSGPDATGDSDRPLRLAEAAAQGADEFLKADALRTLGAVLYRTGRCDGAMLRLAEAIQARGGEGGPADWAFLAMAHHRLGHRAEARRWLDRLREYRPSEDPARLWDELEARVLRSEAEAVILNDRVLPADPFAH
jgi:tetratricopeptide (TPR) repeat protein